MLYSKRSRAHTQTHTQTHTNAHPQHIHTWLSLVPHMLGVAVPLVGVARRSLTGTVSMASPSQAACHVACSPLLH